VPVLQIQPRRLSSDSLDQEMPTFTQQLLQAAGTATTFNAGFVAGNSPGRPQGQPVCTTCVPRKLARNGSQDQGLYSTVRSATPQRRSLLFYVTPQQILPLQLTTSACLAILSTLTGLTTVNLMGRCHITVNRLGSGVLMLHCFLSLRLICPKVHDSICELRIL